MSSQYKSSASHHSRSMSQINYPEELTDQELRKQVEELKHQLKSISLENEIFERTIMRLEPSLMNGIQQALEYANKLHMSSPLNNSSFVKSQTSRLAGFGSLTSPSRLLTSPSKVSTIRVDSCARIGGTVVFGAGPRINVLERSELVAGEMEILVKCLERERGKAAKRHALLKAQLEEIEIRVMGIQKANQMFETEVVIEGWDKIAQRIPAEIWIRFMTEWVKIADSQIGKLRLRTSTLNTQFSKLRGQIKVKQELSESLRAVDFEKLKIENNECLLLIDQKFQQLGELKKMTGDANLTLSIHKKAMMEQDTYLTNVLKSIKEKARLTIELDKEGAIIRTQANSLAEKLDDVRRVRLAYEVPDVMDYVGVKSEVTDLRHSVKLLENRVHVQQIALASVNRKLNTVGGQ